MLQTFDVEAGARELVDALAHEVVEICLGDHVHTEVTDFEFPLRACHIFLRHLRLSIRVLRRRIPGTEPSDHALEVRVDEFLLSELFGTFVVLEGGD